MTRPRGITSPPWKAATGDARSYLLVLLPRKACRACPGRLARTGNAQGPGPHLTLLPEPLQQIQSQLRTGQQTPQWQQRRAIRAGCEATVSETAHPHGLRHCRCRGLTKTRVQHVLTAVGANIIRLAGCHPPGTTPTGHHARSAISTDCASGHHPSHQDDLTRDHQRHQDRAAVTERGALNRHQCRDHIGTEAVPLPPSAAPRNRPKRGARR